MKASEAIEKLTIKRDDALHFQKLYRAGDVGWSANESKAIAFNIAINTLQQIDEPQAEKVEVPDFVAEWYEKKKRDLEYNIWEYIYEWGDREDNDFKKWMNRSENNPIETLIRMKDGYTGSSRLGRGECGGNLNPNVYDEMKRLADELIDLSEKNGLACLVSFETKIPDTCYVSFVGTADKLGYTVNFMERSLEGKTHYSMRAIKEKGYQYGYYQSKRIEEVAK